MANISSEQEYCICAQEEKDDKIADFSRMEEQNVIEKMMLTLLETKPINQAIPKGLRATTMLS